VIVLLVHGEIIPEVRNSKHFASRLAALQQVAGRDFTLWRDFQPGVHRPS